MRDLNVHEFEEVHGGFIVSKVLGNASNLITFITGVCEAYLFLVQKEGTPDYQNFDPLGNFSGDMIKG